MLAAVGAGGIATAGPAQAHPFGDPQTVVIASDQARADVVRVHWKVGGLDDLTLLGVALGVLPQSRVMLDGAAFFEPADAAAIGPSAKFTAYLLAQIKVRTKGRDCAGVVESAKDLAKTGVEVAFTCPEPVVKADVTVRMLTDLNAAYRTLATGPNGDRTVYSTDKDTYDWVISGAAAARQGGRDTAATGQTQNHAGRSAAGQLSAVAGVVAVLAAVALIAVRGLRGLRGLRGVRRARRRRVVA
ncbi:hypothetical protein [Streptomyces sp. SID13031]|uniref:hypothetical protein n=1 Tax=Streptomyces sp. SID13031 TaxID=2706046 RepID=UPI0013CCF9DD|nr:hypothetical protein [Streptomyces sp. SID13031]NEA33968.1 hypothetical protein [Streptomyces sp. SID13031]